MLITNKNVSTDSFKINVIGDRVGALSCKYLVAVDEKLTGELQTVVLYYIQICWSNKRCQPLCE